MTPSPLPSVPMAADWPAAAATATCWCGTCPPCAQSAKPPATDLPARDIEARWAALAGADAAKAFAAINDLAAAPRQAVPFLKERLKPASLASQQVEKWIAALDSINYAEREQATGELKALGPPVEPALRKALAGNLTAEARRRLEALLAELVQEVKVLSAEELAHAAGYRGAGAAWNCGGEGSAASAGRRGARGADHSRGEGGAGARPPLISASNRDNRTTKEKEVLALPSGSPQPISWMGCSVAIPACCSHRTYSGRAAEYSPAASSGRPPDILVVPPPDSPATVPVGRVDPPRHVPVARGRCRAKPVGRPRSGAVSGS